MCVSVGVGVGVSVCVCVKEGGMYDYFVFPHLFVFPLSLGLLHVPPGLKAGMDFSGKGTTITAITVYN